MLQNEKTLTQPPSAPRHHRPRSGPRVAVNKRAIITMPRTGRPHPVLLVDLSTGGACVQADLSLAVGDEVLLRAEISPEIRFAVRALVLGARSRRQTFYGQYGLRFVRVDDDAAHAIQTFVATARKTG